MRSRGRWSNYVFGGLFALGLYLFFRILLPFMMPIILGIFLVVLFLPLQRRLKHWLPGHETWVAGLCTGAVVTVILVPLIGVGWLFSRELVGVGSYASSILSQGNLRTVILHDLPPWAAHWLGGAAGLHLEKELFESLARGAGFAASLLAEGTVLVAEVVLMCIAMYYFFLDGERIYVEVRRTVPIDGRYLDAFSNEFRDVAYALFYGNAVTGVVQGVTGWFGFWIAGVPHAWIWAILMVAVSFLPVGGTAIIWAPVAVWLLLEGHLAAAIFVTIWGLIMIGIVDNLVRPRVCSAKMTLHPLLVFLSMFGGFTVFGVMGILVGPLIASLFMAMVRIYRRDFLSIDDPPKPQTPPVAAKQGSEKIATPKAGEAIPALRLGDPKPTPAGASAPP